MELKLKSAKLYKDALDEELAMEKAIQAKIVHAFNQSDNSSDAPVQNLNQQIEEASKVIHKNMAGLSRELKTLVEELVVLVEGYPVGN